MRLSALLPSWKLALDAAGKSPKTISSYLDSAKRLAAYLTTEGFPSNPKASAPSWSLSASAPRRPRPRSITATSASTFTGC